MLRRQSRSAVEQNWKWLSRMPPTTTARSRMMTQALVWPVLLRMTGIPRHRRCSHRDHPLRRSNVERMSNHWWKSPPMDWWNVFDRREWKIVPTGITFFATRIEAISSLIAHRLFQIGSRGSSKKSNFSSVRRHAFVYKYPFGELLHNTDRNRCSCSAKTYVTLFLRPCLSFPLQ